MSEWQPFETAPKDGTLILLGALNMVFVGRWEESYGAWHLLDGCRECVGLFFPKYWMPLPEPPKEASDA